MKSSLLRPCSVALLASVIQSIHAQPTSLSTCSTLAWSSPPAVLELTYQQPANMTSLLIFNAGWGTPTDADSLLCVSFTDRTAAPRFETGDCDLIFTTGMGEVPSVNIDRTLYISILTPSRTTMGAVGITAFNVFLLQPVFADGTASVDLPALAKDQSYMLPADVVKALESQNGVRVSIRGFSSKLALSVGRLTPGMRSCPQAGHVGNNLFAPSSTEPEILIPPSYLTSGVRFVIMTQPSTTSPLNRHGGTMAAGHRLGVDLYNNCSVVANNKSSPCSVWGGVCKFPCDGMHMCDARGKLPECVCARGYSGLDCNVMSCSGGTNEPCEGSHGVFQRECTLNNLTSTASWSACKPTKCDLHYVVDSSGYSCTKQRQPQPSAPCDDFHISKLAFGLSLAGSAVIGGILAMRLAFCDPCRRRVPTPNAERESPADETKEPLIQCA